MEELTRWIFDYHNALTLGGTLALSAILFTAVCAGDQLRFLLPPRLLKGLPIRIIYVCIVGLAIYGLIGHRLTA